MFDHHLVEVLIIAVGNERLRLFLVKTSRFADQSEKRAPAVVQMVEPMRCLRGAEWMHVEADVLAVPAVAVSFKRADLIECDAKIVASKRLVLVELQSILVIQVQGPQLAESHREINF